MFLAFSKIHISASVDEETPSPSILGSYMHAVNQELLSITKVPPPSVNEETVTISTR